MSKKKEKYVICKSDLYVPHDSVKLSTCVRNCLSSSTYFDKVSESQFERDLANNIPISWDVNGYNVTNADIKKFYNDIYLPERATIGSAGYDFFAPFTFKLTPGETIKIPTGIRAEMQEDWVLQIYPRSGLGFKYRLQMNNTVGIIDSDYFFSDNEGHIFMKITNDSNEGKTVEVPAGTGFAQGIFMQYGITEDDDAEGIRNGGFGSTTK